MWYGSGKHVLSFGSLAASTYPNSSGGGFVSYSSTSGSGGFMFGSSPGRSESDTFPKIKTKHIIGE